MGQIVDKRRSGTLPESGEIAINEDISEIEGGPDRRRSGPPEKSYSWPFSDVCIAKVRVPACTPSHSSIPQHR